MISAAPSPSERKKAHSWETPRSFGLTTAIASEAASLAAEARSPTASRAAPARSPMRSAPLRRSSTMNEEYSARAVDPGATSLSRNAGIDGLSKCGNRNSQRILQRDSRSERLWPPLTSDRRAILRSYPPKSPREEKFDVPDRHSHAQERSKGPLDRAAFFDCRNTPVRRDRVGDPRCRDRRPGEPGLRAARGGVPQELEPERDQHRRPEVLPREARLRSARVLGQTDD